MNNDNRTINIVNIFDDLKCELRFKGSSKLIVLNVLEYSKNINNEYSYILFDRVIHKTDEEIFLTNGNSINGYSISGCVASQLIAF